MSILNEKDFVYTRDDDGNVQSGGYKIESLLLEKGIPIKPSSQQIKQKGGGVASILADLAVPAGLLYMQQNVAKHFVKNVCAKYFVRKHFENISSKTSATYLLKDHRLCWPYKLYGAVGCLHMDMRYVNTHKHFVHPGGDAYFFYSYSLGTFLQQSRLEANKVDCVVTANRFVYSWMKSFKNVL